MQVSPITSNNTTFNGYKCTAKTLFNKGKLPQLKNDIYGHKIENATTEHLLPKSKGGTTADNNTVVCDALSNNTRSDSPLIDYIDFQALADYCDVFRNRVIDGLEGNKYIAGILKSIAECIEKGV